jgi:hypothetical protein
MGAHRKPRSPDRARAIRHLISVDASNVLERVAGRQDEMVGLFSRLRERGPLVGVLRSWFCSVTFSELAQLAPVEQLAINRFYEQLDSLRWYLQHTEDMPTLLQSRLTGLLRSLRASHRALTAAIGSPDGTGDPLVAPAVEVGGARSPGAAAARRPPPGGVARAKSSRRGQSAPQRKR